MLPPIPHYTLSLINHETGELLKVEMTFPPRHTLSADAAARLPTKKAFPLRSRAVVVSLPG
jgi:hypothetical protein